MPPARRLFSATVFRTEASATRLVLKGELDLSTVSQVEACLDLATPDERLVVDMSGLTFLDSTGIGLLLRLEEAAAADGWELTLVPAPPDVQRVLQLVDLDGRLPFAGSAPAA